MLTEHKYAHNRALKLAFCVAGLLSFFLVYGIAQERLMTTSYGPNGEKFTETAFLVLLNRVVSLVFSMVLAWFSGESLKPSAPLAAYVAVSVGNFLATFCQYEALKYVTFPTQTLGKCAKMIPVLIIGSFYHKKMYSWHEYAVALLITIGCTTFLTTGTVSYHSASATMDTPFGLFLICAYLGFDGFTSTTQERLFRAHKMTTNNQILYVNTSSAILSLITLLLPIGESARGASPLRIVTAFEFATANPVMLMDAFVLSLCSSFGQLVIYYTIKEFGALVYSTIMTTRQFLSIFLSAVLFAHPITSQQWSGAVLVIGALYWKTFLKGHKSSLKKNIETGIDDVEK